MRDIIQMVIYGILALSISTILQNPQLADRMEMA